jgi:hypothetical protein
MRRALCVALIAAFGVSGLLLVGCKEEGPTGKVIGTVKRAPEAVQAQNSLWDVLATYKEPYLQTYAEKLESKPDDPVQLLAAFDKLMFEITGPSGLWRAYVPQNYFGCSTNFDLPICRQIQNLEMSFFPWETLHTQLASITTQEEADQFLSQFGPKLKQYIEYYVPTDKKLESVQACPFFKDRLATFL